MSTTHCTGSRDSKDFRASLASARSGCNDSLGFVLEHCRGYLLAAANAECPGDLAGKIAPSDLVQQTLLEAHRDFGHFQGQRREHMLAWLNRILRNNMLTAIRSYRTTAMRNVGREISATELPEDDPCLEAEGSPVSPASWMIAQEEAWLLERAMERLPDEYRQVVVLRCWHQLSFPEIGKLMQRTPEAVRKLWTRAIKRLKTVLRDLH
ncbi:MAG: sigma-70 family RNA polymerase sigma factor [Planctomycetales bacterium]|nr:sigma-70 family RNA polymerase sigma factor [Planctomycetales bacterium]